MNISLEWLRDFLTKPVEAGAAADALIAGGFPVENVTKHGEDTVLDVEVTSNRGDCLSHVGVAREISALMSVPFRKGETCPTGMGTPADGVTSVVIEAPRLCPHYVA